MHVGAGIGRKSLAIGMETAPPSGLAVAKDATSLKYMPKNATEWSTLMTAAGLATGNPASVWKCQEASGNLADSIGAITLTAANAPSYQTPVSGWTAKAVSWADASQSNFSNTTTAPDPQLTSIALLIYAYVSNNPGARRYFANISGLNISVGVNATGQAEVSDNGMGHTTELVTDGVVRPYMVVLDIVAGTTKMYNADEGPISTGFYNGPGSTIATSLGALVFGGSTTPTGGAVYAAQFAGTAARLTDAQVRTMLQTLGWTVAW